jgi:hypothetical protein
MKEVIKSLLKEIKILKGGEIYDNCNRC